jgi:hypothetical protein
MEESSNQPPKLPFTLPNQINTDAESSSKQEPLLPPNVFLRPSAMGGGLPMGGGLKGPMGGNKK